MLKVYPLKHPFETQYCYGLFQGLLKQVCNPKIQGNKESFEIEKLKVKFIYSEKATKFCKILTLLLTVLHMVKSKVKISQNFVASSEYMNFINVRLFRNEFMKSSINLK